LSGFADFNLMQMTAAFLAAAIMIVTNVALLLYHPFSGDLAISPKPYAVLRRP